MIKSLILLITLLTIIPLASESFSYFDADMIHYDIKNEISDYEQSKSGIIEFNESLDCLLYTSDAADE